jgi:hypothetical protein
MEKEKFIGSVGIECAATRIEEDLISETLEASIKLLS